MSYILEALKRAEAERERERGAVPGLHAQPMAAAEPAGAPTWLRPALWAGGGAIVVLAGAFGWRWWTAGGGAAASPPAQPMAMAAAPAPAALPPAPMPAAPAAPAPAPAPTLSSAASPSPGTTARDENSTTAPSVAPAPPAVVSPLAVNAPVGVQMTPAPGFVPHQARPAAAPPPTVTAAASPRMPTTAAPQAVPSPAPAATPSPSTRANDHVYASASELPGDARGGVPPLAIGGSIYSPNPAARFLIINGQVLHEGDEVANGLTLEKIELKSAVLNYKGYRFRVAY
jgi:general secretion pathway protein B